MGTSCNPDPGFTCSYTGEDVSVSVVSIANAYRGHIILCSGGTNGLIGGLLRQLDPPQHYCHAGIMINDHDLIRHTTAQAARLNTKEYYTGRFFGTPAPLEGLDPRLVQYGWPGTVTQSAEQAFMVGYGVTPPPEAPGPDRKAYAGSNLIDRESPNHTNYPIGAISFDT